MITKKSDKSTQLTFTNVSTALLATSSSVGRPPKKTR